MGFLLKELKHLNYAFLDGNLVLNNSVNKSIEFLNSYNLELEKIPVSYVKKILFHFFAVEAIKCIKEYKNNYIEKPIFLINSKDVNNGSIRFLDPKIVEYLIKKLVKLLPVPFLVKDKVSLNNKGFIKECIAQAETLYNKKFKKFNALKGHILNEEFNELDNMIKDIITIKLFLV